MRIVVVGERRQRESRFTTTRLRLVGGMGGERWEDGRVGSVGRFGCSSSLKSVRGKYLAKTNISLTNH